MADFLKINDDDYLLLDDGVSRLIIPEPLTIRLEDGSMLMTENGFRLLVEVA